MTTEIDQSEDFAAFTIDGHAVEVDLYLASEKIATIERVHKDDLWECFSCQSGFAKPAGSGAAGDPLKCPDCKSDKIRRDESWLDDVAAFVKSLGVPRCGRNGAGKFYEAITTALDAIKKKSSPTLESPGGTG